MTLQRDVKRLQDAPRCGAKTRKGTPCQSPAVNGKRRCRMHGGAKGSGAPLGNQNAFKHGMYSGDTRAFEKKLRAMFTDNQEFLDSL